MTTEYFILTRAVHFGACLLFFGVFAFDRFVAAKIFNGGENEIETYWQKRIRFFSLILLPLILLSGIFWFVLVAMTMSGESPTVEILKTVWTQTQFGTVCQWRSIFWLAAIMVFVFSTFLKSPAAFQKISAWLQLFFSGLLLGGLAWAGHGQENSNWHLLADILHLLVAGFWPTGLLPLFLFLRKLQSASETARPNPMISLVRRFSLLSLISVALLAATGLVNSWFLVGSFANLFEQAYGRWLLLKIILFGFAVAIGAVNLLRLKPRLEIKGSQAQKTKATATRLQFNVKVELLLSVAIIIVVAILGILPPAAR
jgi:copper resistance protein D